MSGVSPNSMLKTLMAWVSTGYRL